MNKLFKSILITALLFISIQSANAATLRFENIHPNDQGWGFVADGYEGLNWDNIAWVDKNTWSLYKAANGHNSVFNDEGLPALILAPKNTIFDFNSAYIRSIFNDGNILSVLAYRSGTVVGSKNIELNTSYTKYNFDFANIDKISFSTTKRDMNMDNIDIAGPNPAPAPEPASIVLGIMGIGSLFGFKKKKQL